MTWTSEKQAARYARLKAEGRCVCCGGGMLPEWAGVRCPTCTENQAEQRSTEEAKERRRPRASAYQRSWYAENRERAAAYQRARRLEKKIRGQCIRCSQPAADDSVYCAPHHEREKTRVRGQARRRRERLRAERIRGDALTSGTVADAGHERPPTRARRAA
jgi:hypothetical protein